MTASQAFSHLRPVHGIAAAAAAMLHAQAAPAQTVERFSLSVDALTGVASNPFLAGGGNNQSSYLELGVAPGLTITEERGSLSLQANLAATQYLRRFGGSYSYDTRLTVNRRLFESLTISAGARAGSAVIGERNGATIRLPLEMPGSVVVEDPVDRIADPLDPDLGLLGERVRRNSLSADVTLDYRPYPEDRLSLTLQAARSSFPGRTAGVGLRNLFADFRYARSFGATSGIGISASIQQTRFGRGGDASTVYQPQINYSGRVSPIWNFSLGVGASFIQSDDAVARSNRSVGLAGEVSACRRGARLRFCLSGSRGAQESGRGSIGLSTSASAQLSYSLSERETLGVAGTIDQVEQSVNLAGIVDSDVRQQSLEANYQLRLRERWEIGVTAAYRDAYRPGRPIAPDFTATATLRVGLER